MLTVVNKTCTSIAKITQPRAQMLVLANGWLTPATVIRVIVTPLFTTTELGAQARFGGFEYIRLIEYSCRSSTCHEIDYAAGWPP
jgi:hypothetical protein